MNEEELKRRDVEEIKARGKIYRKGLKEGFQKGKLEQKKEELELLDLISLRLEEYKEAYDINSSQFKSTLKIIRDRILQLSKEIGGMK